MLLLDISLRFPAITLLALIFCLIAFQARNNRIAGFLAAWLVTLIALLLSTLPASLQLPWLAREIIWLIHLPNMVLLWWFALSLFKDDFRLQRIHWFVFALSIVLVLSLRLFSQMDYEPGLDVMVLLNRLLRLCMVTHMFMVALNGRANDLVESRRSVRILWVAGTLAYILIMLAAETILYFAMGGHIYFTAGIYVEPEWFSTIRVLFLLPFIVSGCFLFLRGHFDGLVYTDPQAAPQSGTAEIDPRDSLTYARLMQAMEDEHYYRETGLGIRQLADHIRVPEHQLRALINQTLGFRNFSSFLNSYRLQDAKAALADPHQARTPILTIATDVGYASLATFNRAFRAAEAMSPSQYRKFKTSESS